MPDGYDAEFLIYALSAGDITKSREVSQMTYPEAVRWQQFKRYENYVLEQKRKRG